MIAPRATPKPSTHGTRAGEHYLGLIISRRASPLSVVIAYDLARALRDAGVPVAGGFDARVKRDCLDLLLRG